jgi:hypothetical protein
LAHAATSTGGGGGGEGLNTTSLEQNTWGVVTETTENTMLTMRHSKLTFAVALTLIGVSPAIAQNLCRPALTITNALLSPIAQPNLQRKWTAVVSANTSECAVNSGGFFDIVFTRLSENAPDLEFRQRFAWSPFAIKVAMDFAADEAVGQYRIENVTACICRDRGAEDRAAANATGRKP